MSEWLQKDVFADWADSNQIYGLGLNQRHYSLEVKLIVGESQAKLKSLASREHFEIPVVGLKNIELRFLDEFVDLIVYFLRKLALG